MRLIRAAAERVAGAASATCWGRSVTSCGRDWLGLGHGQGCPATVHKVDEGVRRATLVWGGGYIHLYSTLQVQVRGKISPGDYELVKWDRLSAGFSNLLQFHFLRVAAHLICALKRGAAKAETDSLIACIDNAQF